MLTVGIIGDFDPDSETHRATNEALRHAARALGTAVTATWLPTGDLNTGAVEQVLGSFDALWAAPGSPYRDMDGALRGIQFTRERGWPFLGT
jgi:CTP synthase (UTP-ammonia lyase)